MHPETNINESKKEIANQIRTLVGNLHERIEDARKLGLQVDLYVSKLEPVEPISVAIFEKAVF